MKVTVGVSNRHIHLAKESVDVLFGKDYRLTKKVDLNQPGQYACEETLTIKTDKSEIKNVRILGPVRKNNQIEISRTDSYTLGINPPVRSSGDIENSEVVTLIGPLGSIKTKGCIIANRHIHMTSEQAKELGLKNNDIVSIKITGEKGGILNNVFIRVDDLYYFELHLDTDDANSHLLKQGDTVEIIKDFKF